MTDAQSTISTAYDLRRQLVREVSTRHLPGESTGYDRAYAYDNAGNPTSWRGATRTFNSDNQETTGSNWTYDGNGNPTSYGGTACTYDVANHLTAYGSEFTAGYRGDGLRAWQQTGTTRKYYLYDGWRPVCELDDEGTVTRTWTFGANGLVAYGQALDLYDWQGNAVNAWTESGTPVTGVVMDAWGQADGAYKFQHGYVNSGEELILCTYRHLDPSRGRWVTRDPIGYRGGFGLYGYVGNRPPLLVDPRGLLFRCDQQPTYRDCISCCKDWEEGVMWPGGFTVCGLTLACAACIVYYVGTSGAGAANPLANSSCAWVCGGLAAGVVAAISAWAGTAFKCETDCMNAYPISEQR